VVESATSGGGGEVKTRGAGGGGRLPGDRGVSGCGGEALTWVPHPHSPGADAGDSAWAHASLALPFSLCGETLRWLLRRPRQAKVEGVRF
jgi:hypothetical protein